MRQGFELGGDAFVEAFGRSAVEACGSYNIRVSVELRPSRVEVPYLGEKVRIDIPSRSFFRTL